MVQMVQNLEGMDFTVVPFGQGFKDMSPPTKELMKLTLEKKIAHGMRWMADNIFIRTDPAGNIKTDKEQSTGIPSEKIDGVIALIMALDRAIRSGDEIRRNRCTKIVEYGGFRLFSCYISAYIIRPIAPASFELVGSIIYLLFVTLLQ